MATATKRKKTTARKTGTTKKRTTTRSRKTTTTKKKTASKRSTSPKKKTTPSPSRSSGGARKKKKPASNKYFGITILNSTHPTIKNIMKNEEEPSIHGTKVWDSSYLVMDYLEKNPIAKGSRVMEIGCGWGPAAVYCAKRFNAKVTGVDADPAVFPYLDAYAAANNVKVKNVVSKYEDLKKKKLKKQDIILGIDVCFWTELIKPLYKVINKSVDAGVSKIIIADPGRSTFHKLCDKVMKKLDDADREILFYEIKSPVKAHGNLLVIEQPSDDD